MVDKEKLRELSRKYAGELLDIVFDLLDCIEKLEHEAKGKRCAKCRGTGQFEFFHNSWGDCPACKGRGY